MSAFTLQLKGMWQKLGIQQKVSLAVVALAFIGILFFVMYGAAQPDFRALVSGMSRAQVYEMSAYLKEQGVKHRVVDNETSILVPSKDLYTLRRSLAEQDMLGEEGTGFELLDSSSFSDSSFMEQKKYDRAVAGELERSFREISGVESARVIIVRAMPSPFLADQNQSSASVKLKMKGGKRLTDRQVTGAIRLTAGAVEGLEAGRVEIVDNHGSLNQTDEEPGTVMANSVFEAERERELYLKKKAQALLDRVVGPGRGMVTIAVDLDFTERSESATILDNKNRVAVSEDTTSSEESTPIPLGGGAVGTTSNVEDAGLNTASLSEAATKTVDDSATRYHVGQRMTVVREDVGHIRGMAVSIILDYKEVTKVVAVDENDENADAADASSAGKKTTERIPYTAAEKMQIEKSVLNAIGFYTAKDYQSVAANNVGAERFMYSTECIDMITPEVEEDTALASVGLVTDDMMTSVGYGVAILVAFALLMIARGQLKRSHNAWEIDRAQKEKADAVQESEKVDEESERVLEKRMEIKEAIRKQIQDNPNAAAEVLKMWIYDG